MCCINSLDLGFTKLVWGEWGFGGGPLCHKSGLVRFHWGSVVGERPFERRVSSEICVLSAVALKLTTGLPQTVMQIL